MRVEKIIIMAAAVSSANALVIPGPKKIIQRYLGVEDLYNVLDDIKGSVSQIKSVVDKIQPKIARWL